jgi:hypothetical protein
VPNPKHHYPNQCRCKPRFEPRRREEYEEKFLNRKEAKGANKKSRKGAHIGAPLPVPNLIFNRHNRLFSLCASALKKFFAVFCLFAFWGYSCPAIGRG